MNFGFKIFFFLVSQRKDCRKLSLKRINKEAETDGKNIAKPE